MVNRGAVAWNDRISLIFHDFTRQLPDLGSIAAAVFHAGQFPRNARQCCAAIAYVGGLGSLGGASEPAGDAAHEDMAAVDKADARTRNHECVARGLPARCLRVDGIPYRHRP
jgi:hypothetical protein